jgi:hypothetical protein
MYTGIRVFLYTSNFIVMADISKCTDVLNGLGGLGFGPIFTTFYTHTYVDI